MAKKNIDLSVVLHDDSDYKDWLVELKERFYSHRLKASCATNGYLLDFLNLREKYDEHDIEEELVS